MRKLSTILQTIADRKHTSSISSKEAFYAFIHESLINTSGYYEEGADVIAEDVLNKFDNDFEKAIQFFKSMNTQSIDIQIQEIKQENIVPVEDDTEMSKLFELLDYVNAFEKVYSIWKDANTPDWYSRELHQSLSIIVSYSNQLAQVISPYHSDVEISINADSDTMKGKQFATIIKREIEWKLFRQILRKHDFTFDKQSVHLRALGLVILDAIKKFSAKM